jgi:hypothetical protein
MLGSWNMKKLLAILVLSLYFITPSWSDDIKDFQIEGMSIGDSLLNYMSREEIKLSKRNYFKSQRKYYVVAKTNNLKKYDNVDLYLKTGDKNYTIRTLGGMIRLDLKECLAIKKNISKEFDKIFSNLIVYDDVRSHDYDKSGKSKQYQRVYSFGNASSRDNHIRIECDTWSKAIKDKEGWVGGINVIAMTTEILDWIYSDYK